MIILVPLRVRLLTVIVKARDIESNKQGVQIIVHFNLGVLWANTDW